MTNVVSRETLQSVSVPDAKATRFGTLEFADGLPSGDTVEKAYDHLNFRHGVNVVLTAFVSDLPTVNFTLDAYRVCLLGRAAVPEGNWIRPRRARMVRHPAPLQFDAATLRRVMARGRDRIRCVAGF
jgi:hypothetical protein